MSFQTKPLACIVCASNFTEHGIVGKHVCYIYNQCAFSIRFASACEMNR